MSNLVTLSDHVVKKLRKLQLCTLEVVGCINTKKDAVRVRKDVETGENWHEYTLCNPNYLHFHTHPSPMTIDNDDHSHRKPPSAADLIVATIRSYVAHLPLQSIVIEKNGYYVYRPRSYTEISSYYHLDELTRDEIAMIVNKGMSMPYTEMRRDDVQKFLDTILTAETQKKHETYEAALTYFYNKLNFDIKYVRFHDASSISSSTPLQRPMRVYAYVPQDQLKSVLELGYLSARAQSELLPAKHSELIAKYRSQYEAISNDTEFQDWCRANNLSATHEKVTIDDILNYLDWRDEATERGSRAIYFLFAPVPTDDPAIVAEIDRQRAGLLADRVLISFEIPAHSEVQIVAPPKPHLSAQKLASQPTSFWRAVWRRSLKRHANNTDVLWFEDVPHGYIVTGSGIVAPSSITVHDESGAPK
jgi:hypothetical protein